MFGLIPTTLKWWDLPNVSKALGEGPPRRTSQNKWHWADLAWANILDSSRETLVLLRIVVLQADLEFNGLAELPLLLLR